MIIQKRCGTAISRKVPGFDCLHLIDPAAVGAVEKGGMAL
jgi:hypothetical protein